MIRPVPVRRNPFSVVHLISYSLLLTLFLLVDSQGAMAIPAFARKYGMPCSACHEAWPKLNNFGQTFKDNGYQMGNDRDAPIFQQPAYWPIALRITPNWHRESVNRTDIDNPATGLITEGQLTTHGFDLIRHGHAHGGDAGEEHQLFAGAIG